MFELTQPITGDSLGVELHRPKQKVLVPSGLHKVHSIGEVDVHKMIMEGEGREGAFTLDHENEPNEVWFGFKGLQDGAIRDVSFFGLGNPNAITLLKFSENTYSYKLENLFVRAGGAGEETGRGTGIHCLTGRDVYLDHVQCEGHDTGIHIDSMESVLLSKINVERCNVGLKVTNSLDDNHGRGVSISGRVYAEGTNVGVQIAANCQVKLENGVKVTERDTHRAIECHGAQCYLDMTGGSGLTHLTPTSFGNEVIVPIGDKVRVIDEGYANRVKTRSTPNTVTETHDFQRRVIATDDSQHRFDFNSDLLANEVKEFEFQYSVTRQANLKVEFYDRNSGHRYDFNTRDWSATPYNRPIPWITNEQNRIRLEVRAGTMPRDIQIRFHIQRAGGLCFDSTTGQAVFGFENDIKVWAPIKK